MQQQPSSKVVRNTAYNAVGRFWEIVVALFMSPYIVRHIGIERFGIWALISVLTGSFGLMDFGIRASFVRFIAEYHAKGDTEGINRVVNTGFVFYSGLAVLICAAGLMFVAPAAVFLKISAGLRPEAQYVFLVGIFVFAAGNSFSPVVALQSGLQRMDVSSVISAALSVPNVVGTVIFLETGCGLPGLIMNNAIQSVIACAVNFSAAHRIMPQFKFNPFCFDRAAFVKLFGFGYKIQVTAWAGWINTQMVKILLARFLGVSDVSFYSLADNVIGKLKEFPLMVASAVMPAASELGTRTEREALRILYFRTMKYQALVLLPIAGGTLLLSRSFMALWMGQGFEKAAVIMQILMAGTIFTVLTSPGASVLNGIGKPQYAMRSAMIAIPVNLILSVWLVTKAGYCGIPIAVSAAFFVSAVYFILAAGRIIGISIREMTAKAFMKPFAVSSGAFLLFYGLMTTGGIKVADWRIFAGTALMYLLVYACGVFAVKHFDEFDKVLVSRCYNKAAARMGLL